MNYKKGKLLPMKTDAFLSRFETIEDGAYKNLLKPDLAYEKQVFVENPRKHFGEIEQWVDCYVNDEGKPRPLYLMYLENERGKISMIFGQEFSGEISPWYRWDIQSYNIKWRAFEAIEDNPYDYSKLTVTWR